MWSGEDRPSIGRDTLASVGVGRSRSADTARQISSAAGLHARPPQPRTTRHHLDALSLKIIPDCVFVRWESAARRLGPQVRSVVRPLYACVPKSTECVATLPVNKTATRPSGVRTLSAGSSSLIYYVGIAFSRVGRVLDEIFARAELSPGARISRSLKPSRPDTAKTRLDTVNAPSAQGPRYI